MNLGVTSVLHSYYTNLDILKCILLFLKRDMHEIKRSFCWEIFKQAPDVLVEIRKGRGNTSSYMLSLAANFAPFKIDFHTDDLDAFGITGTPANFIAVSKKLK
jgi:hypothetical protein